MGPPADTEAVSRCVLRDGTVARVRPLERGDEALITAWFEGLSPETSYARFLAPLSSLPHALLTMLADVDHHDHEALVVIGPDGSPMGIARYIRMGNAEEAEVALAVVDRWSRRGVARLLLTELADRARAEGIRRLCATCLASNDAVIRAFRHIGRTTTGDPDVGVVGVWIDLESSGARAAKARAEAVVRP